MYPFDAAEPTRAEIECPDCGGSGEGIRLVPSKKNPNVPEQMRIPCETCRGDGSVTIAPGDDLDEDDLEDMDELAGTIDLDF
tara:strand:- start:99 stop:344 length:246 start_codon:yes stop_codon:yes gene_type:complete